MQGDAVDELLGFEGESPIPGHAYRLDARARGVGAGFARKPVSLAQEVRRAAERRGVVQRQVDRGGGETDLRQQVGGEALQGLRGESVVGHGDLFCSGVRISAHDADVPRHEFVVAKPEQFALAAFAGGHA